MKYNYGTPKTDLQRRVFHKMKYPAWNTQELPPRGTGRRLLGFAPMIVYPKTRNYFLGDTEDTAKNIALDYAAQAYGYANAATATAAFGSAAQTVLLATGIGAVIVAALALASALGLDSKKISRIFGEREPRMTPEEATAWYASKNIILTGKPIGRSDIEHWIPRLVYGYETFASMEEKIKASPDTAKHLENVWQQIQNAFLTYLGRPDTSTKATSYWYGLVASGQQPVEVVVQAIVESDEAKAYRAIKEKMKTPFQKTLPYIIGAGAILSAII